MPYIERHLRPIGDNNRVKLPNVLRQPAGGDRFIISRGRKTCVLLSTPAQWSHLESELANINQRDQVTRAFFRIVMMWAVDVDVDPAGRIRISTPLKEFADLRQMCLS